MNGDVGHVRVANQTPRPVYLAEMESVTISVPRPFDLKQTLRALGVGVVDEQERWWWATRTAHGLATVALKGHKEGVFAQTWGPGAVDLIGRVPRLVGAREEYEISPTNRRVRDFLTMARGLRLGSTADVHEAIATAVLGQVVTTTEGKRSLRSIVRAYGEPAPGPLVGLKAFPKPEAVASFSHDELHSHGVERKRATTLIEIGRRSKRLDEILSMGRGDAERRLLAVRGVGPWTAAIVMGQAYGDKDAIPVGDYHMPNMIAWALAGEERGDDDRMLELLEPYRPYRRHVLVAIKQSGIKAPRYGPRTAVRRHL